MFRGAWALVKNSLYAWIRRQVGSPSVAVTARENSILQKYENNDFAGSENVSLLLQ